MEDSRIVELFWQRSEGAIAETEKKYGRYCHAIALNILADPRDAEEAVNDTYLDAFNSMPPHRPSVLSAFLGRITRRISIDRWRRRSAEKRRGDTVSEALDELSECVPSGRTVEGEVEARALSEAIDSFVMSLPDTERRVFLRRYWYLDAISQIGGRFGFSDTRVRVMLHRTRQKLWEHLGKEGLI